MAPMSTSCRPRVRSPYIWGHNVVPFSRCARTVARPQAPPSTHPIKKLAHLLWVRVELRAYCLFVIKTGHACPLPLALVFQVETYRGASEGWHPVGRPRCHAAAVDLIRRVRQIRPDYVTRTRCVSPELFPVSR